jgi:hypothetical protein
MLPLSWTRTKGDRVQFGVTGLLLVYGLAGLKLTVQNHPYICSPGPLKPVIDANATVVTAQITVMPLLLHLTHLTTAINDKTVTQQQNEPQWGFPSKEPSRDPSHQSSVLH